MITQHATPESAARFFAGLALCLVWLASPALAEPPKPPVILISVDTLRSDRLPAYGYADGSTPAIDRLRRDGLLFERAYAHTPLTLPSHVSMFTGQWPDVHGVRDNRGYPFDAGRWPFLPSLLQRHGYATAGAVSAYVLHRSSGFGAQGFDLYDDAIDASRPGALGGVDRPGPETLAAVEPWLRQRTEAKKPFFLFFHLFEPHLPHTPPEPFASRHASAYDGEIAAADHVVGRLLSLLDTLELYDGALVIFTSDHGEGLGDHGEEEHGIFLYREAIQVPLILKLPGNARAGESVAVPAQLIDLLPTVLDVLGMDSPEVPGTSLPEVPGTSLLRLPDAPRPIVSETFYPRIHYGWSDLASVILGDLHLIDGPDPELFDLVEDPGERHTLLPKAADDAATLRRHLAPRRRPLEAPSAIDAETRARLAALGYLSGGGASSDGPLPDPKAQLPTLDGLRQAQKHLARGDVDAAVAAYRRVLRDNPRMLDGWQALGDLLRRAGRTRQALGAYRRALDLAGGAPERTALVARLHFELDEVEPAAQLLDTLDPPPWDLLFQLGTWALDLERFDLAGPILRRFIDGAPDAEFRRELVQARVLIRRLERRETTPREPGP